MTPALHKGNNGTRGGVPRIRREKEKEQQLAPEAAAMFPLRRDGGIAAVHRDACSERGLSCCAGRLRRIGSGADLI